MYQYYIKIVPTMRVLRDGSVFHSNQFSVTKHSKVRKLGHCLFDCNFQTNVCHFVKFQKEKV